MLIDEGVIVTDDAGDGWRIDLDRFDAERIPATLTAVLLARLDGLAPEQRRALQHAAVVGRIFWDAAVAALDPSDDVLVALAATRDRDFVHPREPSSFATASEYAFKHALLRDVTYETVLLRDRVPLHRAAAQWIEAVAGDRVGEFRELIADHYLRADEPARAASELLAAGLAWRDQAHVGAARSALVRATQLAREAGIELPGRGGDRDGRGLLPARRRRHRPADARPRDRPRRRPGHRGRGPLLVEPDRRGGRRRAAGAGAARTGARPARAGGRRDPRPGARRPHAVGGQPRRLRRRGRDRRAGAARVDARHRRAHRGALGARDHREPARRRRRGRPPRAPRRRGGPGHRQPAAPGVGAREPRRVRAPPRRRRRRGAVRRRRRVLRGVLRRSRAASTCRR